MRRASRAGNHAAVCPERVVGRVRFVGGDAGDAEAFEACQACRDDAAAGDLANAAGVDDVQVAGRVGRHRPDVLEAGGCAGAVYLRLGAWCYAGELRNRSRRRDLEDRIVDVIGVVDASILRQRDSCGPAVGYGRHRSRGKNLLEAASAHVKHAGVIDRDGVGDQHGAVSDPTAHCGHVPVDTELANRVVGGVGDVQVPRGIDREAGDETEPCAGSGTIDVSGLATARDGGDHARGGDLADARLARFADIQVALRINGDRRRDVEARLASWAVRGTRGGSAGQRRHDALRRDLANAVAAAIGHVDVAHAVHRKAADALIYSAGTTESRCRADPVRETGYPQRSRECRHHARRGDLANRGCPRIGYIEHPGGVRDDAGRQVESRVRSRSVDARVAGDR